MRPGPRLSIKTVCPGIAIFIIDIGWSWNRILFEMGIPMLVRPCPYIDIAPASIVSNEFFYILYRWIVECKGLVRFASDFVCLTDDEYGRTKPGRVLKWTVCPTALSVCLAMLGSCIVCKFYANSCVVSTILAWCLFRNFNFVYITFGTLIALSPTYTCIHKYFTLPKITLYGYCEVLSRIVAVFMILWVTDIEAICKVIVFGQWVDPFLSKFV